MCLLCQWTYYNKIKSTSTHAEYLIIPTTDDDQHKKPANTLFQHPAHTPVDITSHSIQSELTPFSSSASPSKWYTLDNEIMISGKKKQEHVAKFMGVLLFTSTLFITSDNQSLTTMSSSSNDTFELTQDNMVWIGRVFAWSCTCLYLMSRIPQLLKNRRRQSVEGLSASLFIFAVGGNLTYASSILSHPGQTVDSLLEALPYLIGSAGTLMFDFSIFCQFLFYKNTTNHKHNTEQIV